MYLKPTPMSDEHASFFVSAVPGNESSNTTGLNGDRPGGERPSQELRDTDFTQETRHERGESIIIGTNENEQWRRQSTPDNDHRDGEHNDNESGLDQESIELMDNIIETIQFVSLETGKTFIFLAKLHQGTTIVDKFKQ